MAITMLWQMLYYIKWNRLLNMKINITQHETKPIQIQSYIKIGHWHLIDNNQKNVTMKL